MALHMGAGDASQNGDSPESQKVRPESGPERLGAVPKIEGFEGLERLDSVDALKDKQAAFRVFLDKVMDYRRDPEVMKKLRAELAQIDKKSDFDAMRRAGGSDPLESAAKLFAVIGSRVRLGEKGMRVTFDFGQLRFAERKAIGAGHLLPPSVTGVVFNPKRDNTGAVAKRTAGRRGGEYHDERGEYATTFTKTEIFIPYDGIVAQSREDALKAADVEKKLRGRARDVVGGAVGARAGLQEQVGVPPERGAGAGAGGGSGVRAAPPPEVRDARSVESRERPAGPLSVFVLGASQTEGFRLGAARATDPDVHYEFAFKRGARLSREIPAIVSGSRAQIAASDVVVIDGGGNDVVAGRTAEQMVADAQRVRDMVHAINPRARIIFSLLGPQDAVTPDGGVKLARNAEARVKYNEYLRTHFQTVDPLGVLAVQPGSTVARPEYLRGCHYTMSGYRAAMRRMTDEIKRLG